MEVPIDVYKRNIGKIQCSDRLPSVLVCHCTDIFHQPSPCGSVNRSSSSLSRSQWCFSRIDPGEVAVCFGDDGTWCPLYKHDIDGQIHQEYSDGEETVSSSNSDDDFLSVPAATTESSQLSSKQLTTTDSTHSQSSSSSIASSSRASSPFFNVLTGNPLSQVQSISDYDYSGQFCS